MNAHLSSENNIVIIVDITFLKYLATVKFVGNDESFGDKIFIVNPFLPPPLPFDEKMKNSEISLKKF